MNMFLQQYLENKKSTFLACILKQVYAAILESWKKLRFFSEPPNLLSPDPWNWYGFRKTATARKKQRQDEDGRFLSIASYQLQGFCKP